MRAHTWSCRRLLVMAYAKGDLPRGNTTLYTHGLGPFALTCACTTVGTWPGTASFTMTSYKPWGTRQQVLLGAGKAAGGGGGGGRETQRDKKRGMQAQMLGPHAAPRSGTYTRTEAHTHTQHVHMANSRNMMPRTDPSANALNHTPHGRSQASAGAVRALPGPTVRTMATGVSTCARVHCDSGLDRSGHTSRFSCRFHLDAGVGSACTRYVYGCGINPVGLDARSHHTSPPYSTIVSGMRTSNTRGPVT